MRGILYCLIVLIILLCNIYHVKKIKVFWKEEMHCFPHSQIRSRLKLLGFPQSESPTVFREISNTWGSSSPILSIFTEQSPSAISPKRDALPWKSLLTWPLSWLLKAVLWRGKKGPPPLNLSRTSTHCFLPLIGWGAGGVKEQGITTQVPTRAWTRSGTEGTGETACTPLHNVAVVQKAQKIIYPALFDSRLNFT